MSKWSESLLVGSESFWHRGLYSAWNSPGQNSGVGSLSHLQGIFPTQGLNPGLPHCRWLLHHLSHNGSPTMSKETNKKWSLGTGLIPTDLKHPNLLRNTKHMILRSLTKTLNDLFLTDFSFLVGSLNHTLGWILAAHRALAACGGLLNDVKIIVVWPSM